MLPHIPWPHRDITVGKYKAGLHEAWAYLGSESMWDMPGNKRPSLSLGAGQGDLFQQPQIALCFLNWQTPATFDRNDMQLAVSPGLPGRPPFSRKIVLNLLHKGVWWRSLSLRHEHILLRWVHLAVGYTCVGKVGCFRVWGAAFSHLRPPMGSVAIISQNLFRKYQKAACFLEVLNTHNFLLLNIYMIIYNRDLSTCFLFKT